MSEQAVPKNPIWKKLGYCVSRYNVQGEETWKEQFAIRIVSIHFGDYRQDVKLTFDSNKKYGQIPEWYNKMFHLEVNPVYLKPVIKICRALDTLEREWYKFTGEVLRTPQELMRALEYQGCAFSTWDSRVGVYVRINELLPVEQVLWSENPDSLNRMVWGEAIAGTELEARIKIRRKLKSLEKSTGIPGLLDDFLYGGENVVVKATAPTLVHLCNPFKLAYKEKMI